MAGKTPILVATFSGSVEKGDSNLKSARDRCLNIGFGRLYVKGSKTKGEETRASLASLLVKTLTLIVIQKPNNAGPGHITGKSEITNLLATTVEQLRA